MWDALTGNKVVTYSVSPYSVAWSPDGKRIALAISKESSYNKYLSFGSQNKPGWALLAVIFATLILWRRLSMGQAIIQFLRDQVWQGIAGIAAIISLFLSVRSFLSDKSKQAEIDQLKLLLRKGVMYHQTTAPPKQQTQKAPLSNMLSI